MGIFKAYDIRGVYPQEINEKIMEKIGRAFADFIKGDTLAVGYDMRLSSKKLFEAFVKGALQQGKTIFDFGLTSTPMSYFACNHLQAKGLAMITASHNPPQYNGVKFAREQAIPISGESGIMEIEAKVNGNEFALIENKGIIEKKDVKEGYKKHLLSFLQPLQPMKIVIDAGNGMGAQDYSLIQEELSITSLPLYFDIDGSFPNHDANPMKEGSLDMLKKKVIEEKANMGIAFDGDADRVFFIDEKGNTVPSDFITALISGQMLKSHPI